ncbi:hypothetical protein G9A89_008725 [Geosiphon pyriformis]|nr:hypothetical protein G9A89_008725 [Geosiphon pyriformis]
MNSSERHPLSRKFSTISTSTTVSTTFSIFSQTSALSTNSTSATSIGETDNNLNNVQVFIPPRQLHPNGLRFTLVWAASPEIATIVHAQMLREVTGQQTGGNSNLVVLNDGGNTGSLRKIARRVFKRRKAIFRVS